MINHIKFQEQVANTENSSNSASDIDESAINNFVDNSLWNQFDNLEIVDSKEHLNLNYLSHNSLTFKEVYDKCYPGRINSLKGMEKNAESQTLSSSFNSMDKINSSKKSKAQKSKFETVIDKNTILSVTDPKTAKVAKDPRQNYAFNCLKYNSQPMYLNPYHQTNCFTNNNSYYSNQTLYQPPCIYPSTTSVPYYSQHLPINYGSSPYGIVLLPNPQFPANSSSDYSLSGIKPKLSSLLESPVEIEIGKPAQKKLKQPIPQSKPVPKKVEEEVNLAEPKKKQLNMRIVIEKGNVAEYINSQKGSKKLQCILENLKDDDPDVLLIFDHICPYLGKISNHNFGNYFCQSLFKKIPFSKRQVAWKFFNRRNFTDYASHQFGNHSIQALIDAVNTPLEENYVISQLEKHYDKLAFNSNGCYILQRVLNNFQINNCQSLLYYIKTNFRTVSCNTIASNLIKKLIKAISDSAHSEPRKVLIECLETNILSLINDMHGSQVIISMLSEWEDESINDSISEFASIKLIEYLVGWQSRAVINKCLQISKNKVYIK